MNKKTWLLLCTLTSVLIACGGGSGISNQEWNGKKRAPAPGNQWMQIAPLGVPIVPSGDFIPSFGANNVNIIYDAANRILYAQHVNANLYPIRLNPDQVRYWQETNIFQSQLVNNNVTITSYLGADSNGHIYGFGLQNTTPVLFNFDDNTQNLATMELSGAYPSSTQFANLYYYNNSVYTLAQTQSGTIYNYSLVKFDANSGAYQATIDLHYSSPKPFVNMYSLPLDDSQPFSFKYYLGGTLGDGVFYINNNGIVTAIPLDAPGQQTQIGAKFSSTGFMKNVGNNPLFAYTSPISYSHGRLFACGIISENDKYEYTDAILGISSNANATEPWESVGYTKKEIDRKDGGFLGYTGCMNISAYGNKVFASDNTLSDTISLYPYITMVYESSIN